MLFVEEGEGICGCARGWITLSGLRGPYGMPEIGLGQAMYKASALPSALSPAECICCLTSPCEPCQQAALTGSVDPPVGLLGSVPRVGHSPVVCRNPGTWASLALLSP